MLFGCVMTTKTWGWTNSNIISSRVYWDTEKEDVISFVEEFSLGAKLLKTILASFLALIPKKNHANEYISICLIGYLYKIIDKCQNIIFDHIKSCYLLTQFTVFYH